MLLDDAKSVLAKLSGYRGAHKVTPRIRTPRLLPFADDGQTPNNPRFALAHYRAPVPLDPDYDPAAIFERLFASHGWKDGWRDGIYPFLHFHTHAHEVLGIARGFARVQFGGRKGRTIDVRAGDVIILPAGTGHRRLSKSPDLLVVGAYPHGSHYDEPRPKDIAHDEAVRSIAKVGLPPHHPVYGGAMRIWK